MKEWDEFLTIQVTSPEIQRCFKAALYHHQRGSWNEFENIRFSLPIIAAIKEQTEIGWDNFLVGRWSVKWQDIQEKFNKLMKNKRSHQRWATAIIRKLLTISWAIWDF